MTHIIIDGDACPVVDSIIDLTTETGIFCDNYSELQPFFEPIISSMYQHYMLMMDQMQLITKLFQLSTKDDIVVTQDYGLKFISRQSLNCHAS